MEKLQWEESPMGLDWYERERLYEEWLKAERRPVTPTSSITTTKPKPQTTTNVKQVSATAVNKESTQPTPKKKRKRKRTRRKGKVTSIPGVQIQPPKQSPRQSLQRFAHRLIDELKQLDFHVLRYDAKTSNSIYLKLDYGVACSVRISDHIGYDHLHYRFNVIAGLEASKTIIHEGTERHFLTLDDYRRLVTLIIIERNLKRKRYSEANYLAYQEKAKARVGTDQKGFFSQCREV